VDVYSDWIDACDAVAKDTAGGASGTQAASRRVPAGDAYSDGGIDRDDDDLGIMDDELGEAEYND
jgi:transcription elongation factor Elf1